MNKHVSFGGNRICFIREKKQDYKSHMNRLELMKTQMPIEKPVIPDFIDRPSIIEFNKLKVTKEMERENKILLKKMMKIETHPSK